MKISAFSTRAMCLWKILLFLCTQWNIFGIHPKKVNIHYLLNLGYLCMSDGWFSEFVYEVVVNKKMLDQETLDILKQEPVVLPAWDPMGALAKCWWKTLTYLCRMLSFILLKCRISINWIIRGYNEQITANLNNYSYNHLSHGMLFQTMWHFDKCRLRRACAAFF